MGGNGASSRLSAIQSTEAKIASRKLETAYAFDDKGQIIFKKTSGKPDRVLFTKEEVDKMPGKVLTHNHPSGTTFSVEDITLLVQHDIKEIRAANTEGAYSLRQSQNGDKGRLSFPADYKKAFEDKKKELDKIFEDTETKWLSTKISTEKFHEIIDKLNGEMAKYRDQWLKDNAKNYGYRYKFERRK